MILQGDLEEEIPETCSSSDDDLELDETNLGEGWFLFRIFFFAQNSRQSIHFVIYFSEEESEEEDDEDADDDGRTDDDDEDCEEDEGL